MPILDAPPQMPTEMGPMPPGMQGGSPQFPMGDTTVIIQTAMQVERSLAQIAGLSPQLSQLVMVFIQQMRKALQDALAPSMGGPQGMMGPSPSQSLSGPSQGNSGGQPSFGGGGSGPVI